MPRDVILPYLLFISALFGEAVPKQKNISVPHCLAENRILKFKLISFFRIIFCSVGEVFMRNWKFWPLAYLSSGNSRFRYDSISARNFSGSSSFLHFEFSRQYSTASIKFSRSFFLIFIHCLNGYIFKYFAQSISAVFWMSETAAYNLHSQTFPLRPPRPHCWI